MGQQTNTITPHVMYKPKVLMLGENRPLSPLMIYELTLSFCQHTSEAEGKYWSLKGNAKCDFKTFLCPSFVFLSPLFHNQ